MLPPYSQPAGMYSEQASTRVAFSPVRTLWKERCLGVGVGGMKSRAELLGLPGWMDFLVERVTLWARVRARQEAKSSESAYISPGLYQNIHSQSTKSIDNTK